MKLNEYGIFKYSKNGHSLGMSNCVRATGLSDLPINDVSSEKTRGKFSKRPAAQSNIWPSCANWLLNYQPINWFFLR